MRQYIKDHARILAVVSLPVGTFMSAGSNPQPSVLFLQKLEEDEAIKLNNTNYPIFMASVTKIGYDLTTKTAPVLYKKDSEGELVKDVNGTPIIDTDVPAVVTAFKDYRKKYQIRFHDNEVL